VVFVERMMVATVKLKSVSEDEFVSVKEAADLLGKANITIRKMLSDGQLKRYKFKSFTFIRREELKQWQT
jgi:excisionase family DNA binding protein